MSQRELEAKAIELQRIYEEECNLSFPYKGCRRILAGTGAQYEDFISDLSLFFSFVAGYCSRGKRILKCTRPQLIEARNIVCLSFFEKYPEYSLLQRGITEKATPDLFEDLNQYEGMRQQLFVLMGHLLKYHNDE